VQRLIAENLLLVDGSKTYPSYRVRGGQRVEARVPEEGISPEEIAVPVLFEDEYVLVVDKPAGFVALATRQARS
jgi:23S rRNA pseudouridine1911/1915/1917 synthase